MPKSVKRQGQALKAVKRSAKQAANHVVVEDKTSRGAGIGGDTQPSVEDGTPPSVERKSDAPTAGDQLQRQGDTPKAGKCQVAADGMKLVSPEVVAFAGQDGSEGHGSDPDTKMSVAEKAAADMRAMEKLDNDTSDEEEEGVCKPGGGSESCCGYITCAWCVGEPDFEKSTKICSKDQPCQWRSCCFCQQVKFRTKMVASMQEHGLKVCCPKLGTPRCGYRTCRQCTGSPMKACTWYARCGYATCHHCAYHDEVMRSWYLQVIGKPMPPNDAPHQQGE